MKTKILACLFSLFLIFGLSGLASAAMVADTAADELLAGYDILSAKVLAYPSEACSNDLEVPCNDDGDCDGGTCVLIPGIPEFIKFTMNMDNKLPGAMILELDVDGDTETGSSGGMCSMGTACLGSEKIKGNVRGLDVSLWMAFDDQDVDAITSWCRDCSGQLGNCFYKNTLCDDAYTGGLGDCGTADCYVAENPSCTTGDANCFLAGATCQPIDECDNCLEMVEPCPQPESCADGRYRGEWFVVTLEPPQQTAPYLERGRIDMPLPPLGGPNGTETKVCIDFPYRRIVEKLKAEGGATLDLALAADPANLQFSMCVIEDGVPGGNDYLEDQTPICMNAVDAIPDEGMAAAEIGTHACVGDLNEDGSVSGLDTNVYKGDYPRSQYLNAPCPNCF